MATETTKRTTKKNAESAAQETAAPSEKTYTEGEVMGLVESLQEQIKALQAQIEAAKAPSVTVAAPEKERVTFRWQAPVADDNVLEIGENARYASVTGKQGMFIVPKEELGRVLTPMVRTFLRDRWLIVLDGLDETERTALGVDYKPGEVLDSTAFMRLIDLGPELLSIYPALCEGNRRVVAKLVYESWHTDGYAHIKRDVVKGLEDFCSAHEPEEKTFQIILQEMNAKEAERA